MGKRNQYEIDGSHIFGVNDDPHVNSENEAMGANKFG